ncbi:MAG: M43 family zinc metalloprotease, partial [Saprospiraceae bacterium]
MLSFSRHCLFGCLLTFPLVPLSGQSFSCGTDPLHQRLFEQQPMLRSLQENLEQQRLYLLENSEVHPAAKGTVALYTIPVVVHIVHQNGTENISDAQVAGGIAMLNAAFANTGYYDQGNGMPTPFRFCLASQMPDGKATTGIVRIASPLTEMIMETQDLTLKNLSRWNPHHYLNVWLVRSVTSQSSGPGVAGYAYFPSSHGTDIDGIVMEAQYFGSSEASNGVLVHEAGHYLGLYHTFEGGCTNIDCTKDGDRVCDTPPDQSTAWLPCGTPANTCSTDAQSGFSADQPDMTINYMDYATLACYNAFTAGQSDRMDFFFNQARASLLESKGCLDPCLLPVSAVFSASAGPVVPAGSNVNFTCTGPNVQTYAWEINGVPASNSSSLAYAFNAPGQYVVRLTVNGADPNCYDKQSDTLLVICGVQADFSYSPIYPEVGDTVVFANTTTGGTTGVWAINGTPAGSTPVLSQVFSAPGTNTICLTASDSYCQDVACKTIDIADTTGCAGSFFKTVSYPLGTNPFLWGLDLLQLPDGDLLGIGGRSGDQYFVRYSPDGLPINQWRYPGPGISFVTDAMTSGDGHAVFTRSVVSTSGSVQNTCYVAKMNCDTRQPVWYKNLSHPTRNVLVWHVTENPVTQSYEVFGRITDSANGQSPTDDAVLLSFNPTTGAILAQKNYRIGTVPLVRASAWANNDLYAVGTDYNANVPMLCQLDGLGNTLWSKRYSFSAPGVFNSQLWEWASVRYDAAEGALAIAGSGTRHVFFLKTDLNGQPVAARIFFNGMNTATSSHVDRVNIDVLPDGYLLSFGQATSDGRERIVLLKLDKSGNLVWKKSRAETDLNGPEVILQNNHVYTFSGLGIANNKFFLMKTPLAPPAPEDCVNDSISMDVITPQWSVTAISPVPVPVVAVSAQTVSVAPVNLPQTLETVCSTVVCPEICNNNLDDDGDGLTDCADTTDCPCANPECAIPVPPVLPNVVGKEEWYSQHSDIFDFSQPIVANLNPQQGNIPEIIVSTYNPGFNQPRLIRIYAGDGSNAASPAQISFPGTNGNLPQEVTAAGDLDSDGIPELIAVLRNKHMQVYANYNPANNPAMDLVMETNQLQALNCWPGLADFDGDGRPEIYIGHQVFRVNHAVPGLNKLTAITAMPLLQAHFASFAADLLSVADCNGDPDCEGLELVTGNTIYSVDLADTPEDGDPRAIIPRRTVADVPGGSALPDGPAVVADIDLDGVSDIVTRVWSSLPGEGYLYAWNAKKFIWKFEHSAFSYAGSNYIASVANVFDDTKKGAPKDLPEIFYGTAQRLYCLNLNAAKTNPANPFWWSVPHFDVAGYSNPVSTFDFDGDGQLELVTRDMDSLRVLYGGAAPFPAGVQPNRTWFTLIGRSGTGMEYPAIADVDNDGQAEIVFVGAKGQINSNLAPLRVIGADLSKGKPWQPARRLWNQYSYAPYVVNDDLSIPAVPQPAHVEIPAGSDRRPLNTVLGQKPVLEIYNGYEYLPDAALSVKQTHCTTNQIEVRLQVCNIGLATLPAGTPLRFYLGDPTAAAAVRLPVTAALTNTVPPDSCAEIPVLLPKNLGQPIFVVVNDNGSQPTPFALPADFPLTNTVECNYANNLASFELPLPPPPPALGPDVAVCENGVWTFSASAGFQQYRWSNLSADSTITVYEPGTYWVEATDHCGQTYRDTVVVTVAPAGIVSLGPDRRICADSVIQFQATPGFAEYSWFPDADLSCSDCPDPVATLSQSRTYTIQAKNLLGCFSFDTVRVEVGFAQNTAEQRTVCAGDSVLIFGNYQTMTGAYAQTFSAANGCDSVHTISLAVLPVFQTAEALQICAGDSVLIFGNYQTMT